MTVYKLTKQELLQALADYLTKKYGVSERFEADMTAQIDPITGGVIINVTEWAGKTTYLPTSAP